STKQKKQVHFLVQDGFLIIYGAFHYGLALCGYGMDGKIFRCSGNGFCGCSSAQQKFFNGWGG
ncbi:MAG: hypothetical protein ACK4S0_05150, partial [Sediminibacterium sp.]